VTHDYIKALRPIREPLYDTAPIKVPKKLDFFEFRMTRKVWRTWAKRLHIPPLMVRCGMTAFAAVIRCRRTK
jgi:hypothetical protein